MGKLGAESAGQSAATLFTLTACCKRAGIDPVSQLADGASAIRTTSRLLGR